MAGSSLQELFAKFVRGREELDYDAALSAAGLRLDKGEVSGTTETAGKAYLGAEVTQESDRLMVRRVYAGSPAYEQGLNTGDQILALDNRRVTKEFFDARLAEKRPGELANLTIFRFDDLRLLPVKLGAINDTPYRIVELSAPSSEQKRIYQSWLGLAAVR
jgi:predicted metalloprotease with PDZ domain